MTLYKALYGRECTQLNTIMYAVTLRRLAVGRVACAPPCCTRVINIYPAIQAAAAAQDKMHSVHASHIMMHVRCYVTTVGGWRAGGRVRGVWCACAPPCCTRVIHICIAPPLYKLLLLHKIKCIMMHVRCYDVLWCMMHVRCYITTVGGWRAAGRACGVCGVRVPPLLFDTLLYCYTMRLQIPLQTLSLSSVSLPWIPLQTNISPSWETYDI